MRITIVPASPKTSVATIRRLLESAGEKHDLYICGVYRDLTKVPAEFTAHPDFHAVQGDVEDGSSLSFGDAECVLTCTPPCTDPDADPIDRARFMAQNVKDAVERAGSVRRLVLLSSLGAEYTHGTGELLTNHVAEQCLGGTAVPEVAFIRCSYFMENWTLFDRDNLVGADPFFTTLITPPDWKIPMIAVDDIGAIVAETLTAAVALDHSPCAFELHGPSDYSSLNVQGAFAEALGRPVRMKCIEKDMIEEYLRPVLPPKSLHLWVDMTLSILPGGTKGLKTAKVGKCTIVRGVKSLQETIQEMVSDLAGTEAS